MADGWDVVNTEGGDSGWEVASVVDSTPSTPKTTSQPKAAPEYSFVPDGRAAVLGVYPNVRITDNVRKPGTSLALANPNSYHLHSNAAVDVAPIPGMSFDDYIDGYRKKGYQIIESKDEVNDPSPWATGPHWHVVLGQGQGQPQAPSAPATAAKDWDVVTVQEPKSTVPQDAPIDHTHQVDVDPVTGKPLSADVGKDQMVLSDEQHKFINTLQGLAQQAAKTNLSPADAEKEIIKQLPTGLFTLPKPGEIAAAVDYMRKHGVYSAVQVLAPNGSQNPDITVSKKNDYDPTKDPNNPDYNPNLNVAQRFQRDAVIAVNEGLSNILSGVASVMGITDPNDPRVSNSLYSDPHGWARTLGVPVGEFLPLLAAPETGIFEGTGVGGAAVKTGLEGAGVGLAASGGDPAKMMDYALGNEVFHALGPVGGTLLKEGAPALAYGISKGVKALDPYQYIDHEKFTDPQAAPENWVSHPQPEAKAPYVKPTPDLIREKVSGISDHWANRPDLNIVQSVSDLPKKMQAMLKRDKALDAQGFYAADGSVHIIADNIGHIDDVPSILFHETLGHAGLAARYGEGLAALLDHAYETNFKFRDAVNTWVRENGYKLTEKRRRLGAEEVLAGMAEKGPPEGWAAQAQELLDRAVHYVREFARQKGMDLRLTDGEIRAILSKSRRSIIKGEGVSEGASKATGNKYIRVWHGSPHDFKNTDQANPHGKFDSTKMGTGEGAQVFGHGHYLTATKRLGEWYRDKLSGRDMKLNGQSRSLEEIVGQVSRDYRTENPGKAEVSSWIPSVIQKMKEGKTFHRAEDFAEDAGFSYRGKDMLDSLQQAINYVSGQDIKLGPVKGHLYEAEINDAHILLDWDRPLSEQPDVIKTLKDKGYDIIPLEEYRKLEDDYYSAYNRGDDEAATAFEAKLVGKIPDNIKGEDLYTRLVEDKDGFDKASQFLHESGIAGHKYLDGFSRGREAGSHNYVMYDGDSVTITNKYRRDPSKKVGNLSADAMNSTKDIEDYIRGVAAEADITPEMRAQSRVETKRLADNLGLTVSKLTKMNPELLKPEVIYAARDLLERKTQDVLDLADRVASGKSSAVTFRKAVIAQAAVQEWVSRAAGNAGRALNAFGIKLNDAIGVDAALKDMDLGRLTDDEYLRYLAKRVQENKDNPAAVNQAVKDATNKHLPEDWLTSYHYAAMLSGYKSLEHNVVGHFFGSVLNNVTHVLAGTMGSAAKLVGVNNPELLTLKDFSYRLYGYANVLTDSALYKDSFESFKTSRVKDDGNNASWANAPRLPSALTAPERLHSASYTFFGDMERAANLYQAAARQASSEGLKGAKLFDRIQELAHNPTPAMAKMAMRDANAVRFMGEGQLGKYYRAWLQRPEPSEVGQRFLRLLLQNIAPFANIAEQKFIAAGRYVPGLGHLIDPFTQAQWAEGLAGRQMVLTRYMMGATAITMAYNLPDEAEAFGKDIVAEVPVLNLMKVTRDAVKNYQKLTSKSSDSEVRNAAEAVMSAFSTFTSEMQNETFLKSIGDYFVARSRGDTKAGRAYWARQAQSWMPFSAATREATKAIDPYQRDTAGADLPDTIVKNIQANTPGLSQDLPVRHDRYGRVMAREPGEETDTTVQELQRLSDVTGEDLVKPVNASQIKKYQKTEDPSVTQNYQRVAGEYTLEALRSEMATDEWKQLSDEDKVAKVRAITKEMRKAARDGVFNNNGWEIANVR